MGRVGAGKLGRVERGETGVGMNYMKEELIFMKKKKNSKKMEEKRRLNI